MNTFRLAILTAVATFGLLLVGGTVNPTGSSLACPDWPLCYGSLLPEMTGGVLYENSHRLAAETVGLLTCALAAAVWWTRRDGRRVRRLALLAIAAVAVQALLGGITVLLELPTLVSTAHLALGTAFLLLVVYLTFELWPGDTSPGEAPAGGWASPPRRLSLVLLVAAYLQVVLGGFVRHTGAGRVCGTEFPTCGGEWWPAHWAPRIHQLHRGVGVLLALVVLVAAVALARRAQQHGRRLALGAALAAPALVVVQVVLGVLTVTSGIGLAQVMGHFGVGMLLVLDLFLLHLGLGPLVLRRAAPSVAVAEGRDVPVGART